MSTKFLVDSQWHYKHKGRGSLFAVRNVIGRGDTPLAVRVGWVQEMLEICGMCARDVQGATSELGDDVDLVC